MASFGNLSVAVNNTTTTPTYYGSVWDSANDRLAIIYYTSEGTAGSYLLIAEKSGGVLVYGTPQLLVAGTLGNPQILFDSANSRVVIAAHDNTNSQSACWVAAVNPTTNSATIGSAVEWLPTGNNANNVRVCYDSTNSKVIIFCIDSTDASTMKTVVGTVSGTTITFGTPGTVAPSPGPLDDYALAYDSVAAKVILFFTDQSYSATQYYIGTVSGTSISFGSKFLAESVQWYSLYADWNPNAQKVIVNYQPDYGSRVFKQGALSGSTFTWDDAVPAYFSGGGKQADNVLYNATNDKFLLFMGQTGTVYQEVTVSGDTSVFSSASVVYEAADWRIRPATVTDGNDFFVYETDDSSGVRDLKFGIGDASVSAASPCPGVTLGLEQTAAVGYGNNTEFRRAASIGGNRFIFLYRDDATNNYTVVAGQTDSAGDITFGTPVLISGTDAWQTLSLSKAGEGKACVFGENVTAALCTAHLITVTGLSISVGAANRPVVSGIDNTGSTIDYDPASGKVVAVWAQSSVMYSCVGTPSGTTISWGTPVNNGAISLTDSVLTNIDSGKFTYAYNSTGAKIRVANISGSGLAFGSEYVCDDISAAGGTSGQVAVDPATGNLVVSFFCSEYPQNMDQRVRLASVSGTAITWLNVSSPLYHASINETRTAIAFDPYSGALISAFQTDDAVDGLRVQASDIQDDGYIQNCPAITELFREGDGFPYYCHDVITDEENEYAVVIYWEQNGPAAIGAFTVRADLAAINYNCTIKPLVRTIEVEGAPGSPGFSGQPYIPAYCSIGSCSTTTVTTSPAPGGGLYEYRCVTYTGPTQPGDDISLGFGEVLTVCGLTVIPPSAQSVDPYAPNYDPNYDPETDPNSSTFGGSGTQLPQQTQTCTPSICYPAQNYIPPNPPVAPTPTEYSISYDLGWNYDVFIGSGSNLSVTISTTEVSRATSGIVVGFSNLADWGLSGIGKIPVFVLFEGDQVSVFNGGTRVWGQITRAEADVFRLNQYGTQVSVFKNDVQIYNADVLSGGPVVAGAIIYKAEDYICLPVLGEGTILGATTGPIATGEGDVNLPAFVVTGYEGSSYAVGEVTLPSLELDSTTGNHGEAAITLPPIYVFSADRSVGWALTTLPVVEVSAYAIDGLSGYAVVSLPSFSAVGSDSSGYGFGTTSLPVVTVEASGEFAIPVAQGASFSIPHLMGAATGLTGEIGGIASDLPVFDAVGADRAIYGEVVTELPVPRLFAGELPSYSGVLNGWLGRLEVQDLYGTVYPVNSLVGTIDSPEAVDIHGGGQLDTDIAAMTGELTGTVTNVARFDLTLSALTMNSTGLSGAYGEIDVYFTDLTTTAELWGGGFADGTFGALTGTLSGTSGLVGVLDGTIAGLTGLLTGTREDFGELDGTIAALEPLYGILSGDLGGLQGTLSGGLVVVAAYDAWVMNKSNGAVTTYPDYEFRHLVRWNGQSIVANDVGLYEIAGNDDDGTDIDAVFGLPTSDYGSAQEKRVPRFYLKGGSSRTARPVTKLLANAGQSISG